MARLILDPDEHDRPTTRRLRERSIADVMLHFDDAGRTDDIDDDVADAYAEEYDDLRLLGQSDQAGVDDVGELLAGTVGDIRDAIQAGEYDDRLDEVAQREAAGDDRKGVQEAIDERRDEPDEA